MALTDGLAFWASLGLGAIPVVCSFLFKAQVPAFPINYLTPPRQRKYSCNYMKTPIQTH